MLVLLFTPPRKELLMFSTFAGIVFTLGVLYIFVEAILETGRHPVTKSSPDEPTELDAELEAHIDSFDK